MIWGIMAALVVALVIIMVYNVKKTKQAVNDKNEIAETLPRILEGRERANDDLSKNGVKPTAHASTMGHKFIDYKTKHNAPDNLNVELDFESKKIACYMLNPYEFYLYDFKDLHHYEFSINNGKVDFSTVSLGVGTSIGGIGVGVGTTNGTAQQQITSMMLMLCFKNGTDFALNFTQNVSCYQGDEFYTTCLASAKSFCAKLDLILEENNNG